MTEVKLISVTPDAEKLILYCARVSSNQKNESTGLIKYLIKNNHWSPFELAHAVVEITTSRAIAQQILRHRSFSFQEFSQRYAPVVDFETYNARRQHENNRQSSVDDLDDDLRTWFFRIQHEIQDECMFRYQEALDKGIAKEQARFLLPSSARTKMYMAGSIRSWIHYCKLRCDEHTQLEHRLIATRIRNILFETGEGDNYGVLPIIGEALNGYWQD